MKRTIPISKYGTGGSGDITSSSVINNSTVAGANVTEALETLQHTIPGSQTASTTPNDSTVEGTSVADALEYLDTNKTTLTIVKNDTEIDNAITKAHDPVTKTDSSNISITLTGQQISADLINTTVSPGDYTNANISVDANGRITVASNGTSGGGKASEIENDSSVTGTTVKDALDNLNSTLDLSYYRTFNLTPGIISITSNNTTAIVSHPGHNYTNNLSVNIYGTIHYNGKYRITILDPNFYKFEMLDIYTSSIPENGQVAPIDPWGGNPPANLRLAIDRVLLAIYAHSDFYL